MQSLAKSREYQKAQEEVIGIHGNSQMPKPQKLILFNLETSSEYNTVKTWKNLFLLKENKSGSTQDTRATIQKGQKNNHQTDRFIILVITLHAD